MRVSHEQNLVLPDVRKPTTSTSCGRALARPGWRRANSGLVTDIIACPGLDYCSLANARSIPIAQEISERFADLDRQHEIGELKLKISGCINACGHHHVGHIGILGVDKKGVEHYQITLGGSADRGCGAGRPRRPGLLRRRGRPTRSRSIIETYLGLRQEGETLPRRPTAGSASKPFKEALYAAH